MWLVTALSDSSQQHLVTSYLAKSSHGVRLQELACRQMLNNQLSETVCSPPWCKNPTTPSVNMSLIQSWGERHWSSLNIMRFAVLIEIQSLSLELIFLRLLQACS